MQLSKRKRIRCVRVQRILDDQPTVQHQHHVFGRVAMQRIRERQHVQLSKHWRIRRVHVERIGER